MWFTCICVDVNSRNAVSRQQQALCCARPQQRSPHNQVLTIIVWAHSDVTFSSPCGIINNGDRLIRPVGLVRNWNVAICTCITQRKPRSCPWGIVAAWRFRGDCMRRFAPYLGLNRSSQSTRASTAKKIYKSSSMLNYFNISTLDSFKRWRKGSIFHDGLIKIKEKALVEEPRRRSPLEPEVQW
jgi:hypothetical protein